VGSVLCGAAHSMMALIVYRAVQGIGAGGLITLAQTTIADLVPPRERGRYQGLVASVFALCSVAGPLLGGVITDRLSWPWIFYINVPVGLAALGFIVTSKTRRRPTESLLFGLLVPVEHRAAEPALPPRLFADTVFVRGVASVSLATTAIFGSIVFIPLFFQLVLGASATEAGLRMAPLMGGLIVSSVIGGRLVTKTGRYKIFPVIGLALATAAFALRSWAALDGAGGNAFDALLACLGAGAGLVMPNITTAIQNAVATRDLGVATATAAFFRSLGGAFGVALAGMLLNSTLQARLPASLIGKGLSELQTLPPASRALLIDAYCHALSLTFGVAAGICALAFIIVLFVPERPLSRTDRV
jgi:MFS family permease